MIRNGHEKTLTGRKKIEVGVGGRTLTAVGLLHSLYYEEPLFLIAVSSRSTLNIFSANLFRDVFIEFFS